MDNVVTSGVRLVRRRVVKDVAKCNSVSLRKDMDAFKACRQAKLTVTPTHSRSVHNENRHMSKSSGTAFAR
jgi:hypothetical protein